MERAVKCLLLFIIVASIIGKLALVPFNQGLWWDEAVYMGLGKSLMHGTYYLNTDIPPQMFPREAFRPPLFPMAIALLSDSMILMRVATVLISGLAILSTHYAARKMFGKEAGLWASLLLATSFFFVFYSTKALSESLFIMLFSLSLLFFSRWAITGKAKRRDAFLAGIMTGLAFVTRYLGLVILASYAVFMLYKSVKGRKGIVPDGVIMLAGFAIALIPMFIIGLAYFHDPLGPVIFNYGFFGGETVELNLLYDIVTTLGLTVPLIIAGFLLSRKPPWSDSQTLAALMVAVSLASYLALPHREARYLLSFYPAFAIFSGFAVARMGRALSHKNSRIFHLLLAMASVALLASSLYYAWNDSASMSCLVQASLELKGMTGPEESIMTVDYPHVAYLSERKAVFLPQDEESFWPLVNEFRPSYLLIYKYEGINPAYLRAITADCTKVKSFEQWGDTDACIIYKINGPGPDACFQ